MTTREGWVSYSPDNMTHHVCVTRARWRTRFYLDGKRVHRWHPYLRSLRKRPYSRAILGL